MSAGSYTYPYPAHYVTTDVVAFTFKDGMLQVLLVRRAQDPYKSQWALPGGFLRPDEEIEDCARRELAEETSLQYFFVDQVAAIGTLGRDPRGRVITVAHLALVRWQDDVVRAGTDAADAAWFPIDGLPALAFDHGDIIKKSRARLEQDMRDQPLLMLKFLPEEFTTAQMQSLEKAVLGMTPERRSFYRRPA